LFLRNKGFYRCVTIKLNNVGLDFPQQHTKLERVHSVQWLKKIVI